LACWPEYLIVIGDAVCASSPVYGQGMTVAARRAFREAEYQRLADAVYKWRDRTNGGLPKIELASVLPTCRGKTDLPLPMQNSMFRVFTLHVTIENPPG
jgi:hypothetical protein